MVRSWFCRALCAVVLAVSLAGGLAGSAAAAGPPSALASHAPGNPNSDCDVIFVHMKKVQHVIDRTVHRESAAKVVCDAFRLPHKFHVTIGIDRRDRRTGVWHVVGTGPRHSIPPIHDHVYRLDMPCAQGVFRGDLHIWGMSSDDVPQNSHYYSTHGGVKPLRIANCRYVDPGGR